MKKTKSGQKTAGGKMRLLRRFLRGCIIGFLFCMLAAILSTLASTLQPQIVRIAVDGVICNNDVELPSAASALLKKVGGISYFSSHLWVVAALLVGVALVQVLSTYAFRVWESRASGKLIKNMRDDLFSHIQCLPYAWFSKNRTGDLIQRSTNDIDTVKGFISEQMTSLVRIALTLVLAGCFMFGMNVKLALIALAPMPVFVIISILFNHKLAEKFEACDENEGKLSAVAQENLSGIRVIRAFGRERSEIEKFTTQNRVYTDLRKRMDCLISYFWCFTDVLAGLQVMSLLVFGAVFCIRAELTEGELIAFLAYNAMLIWPVRELGQIISNMAQAGVSLNRIYEVMSEPIERDAPNAIPCPQNGDIVFSHVSFGYEENSEILHDVSFEIKAGTTLGILGGTGSGKSTLMLLLDKLFPLTDGQGCITVGGVDIRKIQTESLRKAVGIVTQEPYLFSATLGENIQMANEKATAEELESAVQAAALTETVQNFINGYDTAVGEGGVTLSGGQKQRVAIARALLANTPILIFDDSLSAIDTETDSKIRGAISARFGKATVILISHRISTVSAADHIIVLDQGKIVEEGTHQSLKQSGGLYQNIYETQSVKEEGSDHV